MSVPFGFRSVIFDTNNQRMNKANLNFAFIVCKTKSETLFRIPVTSTHLPSLKLYVFVCVRAVSYTHLDVYKRQVPPSLPSPTTKFTFLHKFCPYHRKMLFVF